MKAKFVHDCESCIFLTNIDGDDIYWCTNTIIARYGDEGHQYRSLDIDCIKSMKDNYILKKGLNFLMEKIGRLK